MIGETNSKIIQSFLAGNIPGENSNKPRHVVTAISNVFVFDSKVYKIYKNDSDFFNKSFNDLSIKANRFSFTKKDFEWNKNLSPEIYTELVGVIEKDGAIQFIDPLDNADELVIVMNKVDTSNVLLEKLKANKISLDDCYQIGFQLGKRESTLPRPTIQRNLYEDFISRYEDTVAWAASVEKYIPKEESKKYFDLLLNFIETNKEYFIKSPHLIGPCLDIHADNLVFKDGVMLPMDTYAPKEDWLAGYMFLNIYRVATDIHVFLGKEYFTQTLKGYGDSTGTDLPRKFDKFLLLYCELISCPYMYMLSEKDPSRLPVAEKCHQFLSKLPEYN